MLSLGTTLPFREAVSKLGRKEIMPTALSSAELSQLDRNVRERSFFSARTSLEGYLDRAKAAVESIIAPRMERRADRVTETNPEGFVTTGLDPATARRDLKNLLRQLGYEPDPDKRGTIEDLSSDARVDLVIKTNAQLAQGWGMKRQGMEVIGAFPAWELYRLESRKEPRDWLQRWQTAGYASGRELGDGWTMEGGRMVALKGHPIWAALGSSANFEDALDTDYPPFAFGSGMWVEDVSFQDAQSLGLVVPGQPPESGLADDLFALPQEVLA